MENGGEIFVAIGVAGVDSHVLIIELGGTDDGFLEGISGGGGFVVF